jgi:flagellar protein FliS
MSDVHNQYKETQILTAGPGKLLLMLYDGAITSLEKAVLYISDKSKYDKVNKHIIKAEEIIGELLASLNFEAGGEFARNLQSLYAYMIKKLIEGNMQKKKEPLEEVLKFMKDLRESWAVAVQKVGNMTSNPGNNDGNVSKLNISG